MSWSHAALVFCVLSLVACALYLWAAEHRKPPRSSHPGQFADWRRDHSRGYFR